MKRRNFITLIASSVLLQLIFPHIGFAESVSQAQKIVLIGEIRNFLLNKLSLDIGNKFYTEWKRNRHLMHVTLYISEADRISVPHKEQGNLKNSDLPYLTFWDDLIKAEAYEKRAKEQGYHTMIYQTAGVAYSQLNNRLLSYNLESIAFIVMHEATHRHIRFHTRIPYELEEATCDVIGNYGTIEFMKFSDHLSDKSMKEQTILHEKLHKTLNGLTENVRNSKPEKFSAIYKSGRKHIRQLVKEGGKFVKDRYNYEVNNAYLLRNIYYAENYFLMKELYFKIGDLKEYIDFVTSLPNVFLEAKRAIDNKINS